MNLSKFAERLKELIAEEEITITELSSKINIGDSTLSHYCTGRYLPTVKNLVRLADYFCCSTDFLLGNTEDNDSKNFKACPPFSEQILNVCNHFGISRYQLQLMTDISESVMRYWVRGKTAPSITSVVLIAEKLNCSVDFVLGRES